LKSRKASSFSFLLISKLKSMRTLIRRFGGGRRCGLGRTGGGRVAFDVVGVPGEVALETVFEVRGRGETVEFTGVDDEFGGAAEAF
jgi:hypothetical protein